MNIINNYKRLSVQMKASIWFTICNFTIKGIAFITVPIFTRILSTEEYGTVTLYNSYQQVLMILATFELSLGAYNKGILKYKDKIKSYTAVILWLSTSLTVLSFVIVFLIRNKFVILTDTSVLVLLLTYLMFIFFPAYNCWLARKRFELKYKSAVIVTVLYSILTTFVPLIVLLNFPRGIIKIITTLVVQIVFCVPFYVQDIGGIFEKDKIFYISVLKYTIPYQIPLVFHGLSFLILGQADRIMIGNMVGKSEAAIYSVAYSVGQVIILFQVSLNQVFQPYRFKKMETKKFCDIQKCTNLLLIIIASIVIFFMLVVPEAMEILFTADYSSAIELLPPIISSVFFIFLYNVFSDVAAFYNETSYIMYASVFAAMLNIIGNYYGITLFGYQACAYTTLICYIILAITHTVSVIRIKKNEGIEEEIYDYKIILPASITVLIFCIFSAFLYKHIVVRYILILFIAVVLEIKRKVIFKYIKNIGGFI